MAAKDELGRRGEQLAADHLRESGYRVIERNWRCRHGEIDIVAEREGETVFVEVKTRSSVAYGHPFDAITPRKLARLRRLAGAWCAQTGAGRRIRIDAVGVIVCGDTEPSIEHLKGIG